MKSNNGGPAFPQPCTEGGFVANGPYEMVGGGLSMRDYFAAKAMQGVLATHPPASELGVFVQYAYRIADAMLAERDKENNDADRR